MAVLLKGPFGASCARAERFFQKTAAGAACFRAFGKGLALRQNPARRRQSPKSGQREAPAQNPERKSGPLFA